MAIRDWPETERPREKLLQLGSQSLSNAELVALVLGQGCRDRDAVTVARNAIQHFGTLHGLLSAEVREYCQVSGMGKASYARLQAGLELCRRDLSEALVRGEPMSSAELAAKFLQARLGCYAHEVFACLFLDTRHRVIGFEELFRGTLDGASVHPREVVKRTLAYNAAAVILAHNHPSGVAEPSPADEAITQRLAEALQLIEVRVLDHFIVAPGAWLSFAEKGLID